MTTAVTTLQMTDRTLAGDGIQMGVRGPARQSDERERPSGIDVEIANRLRNLGCDSGMVEVVECRSRFSSTGIAQVRIRMRLKQVTGLVSG
jgi:hypothetical protein